MPTDHRLRLDDFQSVQHFRSQPIQPGKHQAVNAAEGHSLRRFAPQHIELMTKRQDLCLQRSSRPEQSDQRRPNQPAKITHRKEVSTDSRALVSRFDFAVGTGVVRPIRRAGHRRGVAPVVSAGKYLKLKMIAVALSRGIPSATRDCPAASRAADARGASSPQCRARCRTRPGRGGAHSRGT